MKVTLFLAIHYETSMLHLPSISLLQLRVQVFCQVFELELCRSEESTSFLLIKIWDGRRDSYFFKEL